MSIMGAQRRAHPSTVVKRPTLPNQVALPRFILFEPMNVSRADNMATRSVSLPIPDAPHLPHLTSPVPDP